jgi:hypothetical protein
LLAGRRFCIVSIQGRPLVDDHPITTSRFLVKPPLLACRFSSCQEPRVSTDYWSYLSKIKATMRRLIHRAVLAGGTFLLGVSGSALRKSGVVRSTSTSSNQASARVARATQSGDRVSQLDNNGVNCLAESPPDTDAALGFTYVKYYYAVEANTPPSFDTISKLEITLFYTISASLLWCYKRNDPSIAVKGGNRLLETIHENPDCKKIPSFFSRKVHSRPDQTSLSPLLLSP